MSQPRQILSCLFLAANLLPGQAHAVRGVINLPETRFVASYYNCVFDLEQSKAYSPLDLGASKFL
ncbi:hypothetical protein IG631_09597 [Alternaria alternata]|nr:hypothetical protein IG631_09597 [Alternaria alternata]